MHANSHAVCVCVCVTLKRARAPKHAITVPYNVQYYTHAIAFFHARAGFRCPAATPVTVVLRPTVCPPLFHYTPFCVRACVRCADGPGESAPSKWFYFHFPFPPGAQTRGGGGGAKVRAEKEMKQSDVCVCMYVFAHNSIESARV